MEDAYGIGITNRYEFLLDTDANDPQAILKQKAKKAKKAARKQKLAVKENVENDAKVETKPDKLNDEKKTKFVVPGKGGRQSQTQQEFPQKSRSMKDTQNIQGNGNGNGNTENGNSGFKETRNNSDRNYGNNRNYENRDRKYNRRNDRNGEGGTEFNDAHRTYQDYGSNRGNRPNNGYNRSNENNRNNENNSNENGNNENGNEVQDIEYNNQRYRDYDRQPRRQGQDGNYGNRRADGQRRNYDGQRRNFDGRGGKREFDRQSGSDKTGVKPVEKRDGGGAHNWGTIKEDIEDLKDLSKNVSEPDLKDDGNSDENAKSEENLVVEQVTLDEYKQKQEQRAKPMYNIRKAGEGEDKKKWKHLVPLEKKKEDVKSDDEYEFDPAQYPQRKKNIRYITDIQFRFNGGKRPGFTKRRDNRPGRRGDYDDSANAQNAPQVDDRNFPSLG